MCTTGLTPRGLHDKARTRCPTPHEMPHVRSGAAVTVVADSRRQGLATPASVTDMRRSYRREATADFDEDLEGG